MREDTVIVTAGRDPEKNFGVVNPPVYHASTILFPSYQAIKDRAGHESHGKRVVYGRRGTPTSFSLEAAVTALEGGHDCVLFPSGINAITCALLAFLKTGDHLLMVDSVYGPTRSFCENMLARFGVETTYYDPLVGAGIADLIRVNTRVVFTESPGSQTFEMQDIPAIAAAAHARDAVVIMDNTWASPLFFKPFEHGVDVSVQAATKYIVGHSDVMMGTATATEACYRPLKETASELGLAAGPDDIYLAQRGLRTIGVRLRQHQESGLAVARWLRARPEVVRVLHPGLRDDPGHGLWKRDFLGASGLFGMILNPCSETALAAFLDGLELFGMGYSWGGYESLIIPAAPTRTATRWAPEGPCLRLHIGLEDIDDLIADLEAGFQRLAAAG